MKRSVLQFLTVGVLAVFLIIVAAGCAQKKSEEQAAETQAEAQAVQPEVKGQVDADGKATGGTMGIIYEADDLYTCVAHPEVVTDNPEALCPECGIKLEKMSDEAVAKLRESNPKGCPGCAIVVPGDAEMEKCPICGADLKAIQKSESGEPESQEQGEE